LAAGLGPLSLHLPPEGLAKTVIVRARPWSVRVLRTAAGYNELAATLSLSREGRRSLVGRWRRRLYGIGGQAGARHAPRGAGLEEETSQCGGNDCSHPARPLRNY